MVINIPFILLYYLNLYSNHKLKERFFTFFFKGYSETDLINIGKKFNVDILSNICHKEAMGIINWHKKKNHDIYLLTASSDIWLGDWCKQNDIKIIGTKFETLKGLYSGKISGENCYGIQKLNRINTIINEYNIEESYGYGDSKSDRFFLDILNKKYNFPLDAKNIHKVKKSR